MRKLPTRQVHVDFHASPSIEGVVHAFDKAQFQDSPRREARSVAVCGAKCGTGDSLYPGSKTDTEACRPIGRACRAVQAVDIPLDEGQNL